jgi:Domain of unknown function (DUF4868)
MSPKTSDTSKADFTLASIFELNLSDCEITVCLASFRANDDLPAAEKLQLSDELTNDFRGVVKKLTEKWKAEKENGDLQLKRYEAGSKPETYEIEYIDVSEHDSIQKQIRVLASIADLRIFTGDSEFLSGLRFYVIIVQPNQGTPIYFFRLYSHKKELHHSPFFGAVFDQGQFNRVRTPLFLFDQYVDCFSCDDVLFICNKDKFQKIFRFLELVLKKAKSTLRYIKAHVPIANMADFEKACENHALKLAKLNNIASKPYLKQIKMADIKKVIGKFDLEIETTGKGKKEMLVFDPADKWAILRLLDDDYLGSVMTGRNYEVTGKRQLD